MKKLFYLIIPLLVLTSCKSLKQYDSKVVSIKNEVIQYPTLVNLDVQKESVTSSVEWKTSWFKRDISLEVRIGNLIAEMAHKAKADILVEPRFTIEAGSSGWRSKKLTITGYPASYKDFRPATAEDLKALETMANSGKCLHNIQQAQTYKAQRIKRNNYSTIKSWFTKKK